MAPYRLYFIGVQLLFLANMANTFILLTANMDDVKRIAQKFVSDSLADKIAEFVAKASEQMLAHVSQENEQNDERTERDDERYISEEHDNLQHIVRQREAPTTKTALETSKDENSEKGATKDKYKGQGIDWEKEINEVFTANENNVYSKEVLPNNEQKKEKDYDQDVDYDQKEKADYDQQRADYEQSKLDDKKKLEEQRKQDYEEQKLIYQHQLQTNDQSSHNPKTGNPKRKPTNQKPNKTQTGKRTYPKIRKPHSYQKPKKIPSGTTRKTIDSTILYQHLRKGVNHRLPSFDDTKSKTRSTFRGFNILRSITTEKARIEFDQYDNPNYPKTEFIATSGPVLLPKVAMAKPWWEMEMTLPD